MPATLDVRMRGFTSFVPYPDDHFKAEGTAGVDLIEFAGRNCYQSWDRPSANTDTNEKYLAHVMEVGHWNLLEHSSATVQITGLSRNCMAELTRHRHFVYSVLSQRFVEPTADGYVVPPAMSGDPEAEEILAEQWRSSLAVYRNELGWFAAGDDSITGKRAREAARAHLPGCAATAVVMTGNYTAWREMLPKRLSAAADAEMQQVARAILAVLQEHEPRVFGDIPPF